MIHLSTYNTSYGRKKGWESKCQFDSKPLKVGNHLELHVCKWLLQLEVCIRSYGPPKWWESEFQEFRDSRLRNPEKMTFGCNPWG